MLALMEAPSRRFQIPLRRAELDVAAAFRQFFPNPDEQEGVGESCHNRKVYTKSVNPLE
jgi:hypothetical protein